jgi:serine protease Do
MVPTPVLRRGVRAFFILGAAALTVPAISPVCDAQSVASPREARAFTFVGGRDDARRAVLGLSLRVGSERDTLGVLISDVTPDGPAAKAGLVDGARIVAINGVSLRVPAADAADPELRGLGERRLRRELGKVEPGAEVELQLLDNGVTKTVRVKTVSASALEDGRVTSIRTSSENRPFIGINVGTTGTARDTIGLFVSGVTAGGPAEQAGIIEGERIRSINGVDVRVPREDAGDWSMSSARANRFTRTLRAAKPGDVLTLEVHSGGRVRTVTVTAGKASDFSGQNRTWTMQLGDDAMFFSGPGARSLGASPPIEMRLDRLRGDLDWQLDGLRIDGDRLGRSINDEVRRALESVREAMPRFEVDRMPGGLTVRAAPRLRRISL